MAFKPAKHPSTASSDYRKFWSCTSSIEFVYHLSSWIGYWRKFKSGFNIRYSWRYEVKIFSRNQHFRSDVTAKFVPYLALTDLPFTFPPNLSYRWLKVLCCSNNISSWKGEINMSVCVVFPCLRHFHLFIIERSKIRSELCFSNAEVRFGCVVWSHL